MLVVIGYTLWVIIPGKDLEAKDMAAEFRKLPSVDSILSDERIKDLSDKYSRLVVVSVVRTQLDYARKLLKEGGHLLEVEELVTSVLDSVNQHWFPSPIQVINATGVILHTNLGRAPLSIEALDSIRQSSMGYSDLEFDTGTGRRGSRHSYAARILSHLTGSESAIVVNNNASAIMLGLVAIASGSEVIVSRGESLEIGGGFRIPDVLKQSGATLIEVGTTNRTYVNDYEDAVSDRTGAILSVHSSNFKVTGFTHSPSLLELVNLGRKHNIPVLHDLGSGSLIDTSLFGLAHEPMPQESIAAGASLSFFSGDKLLGGPQAGIIVGGEEYVSKVANHPIARAVRIDKLSLSALTATLLAYLRDDVISVVPVWAMISEKVDAIGDRARNWNRILGNKYEVVEGYSTVGGGSLPDQQLPTWLLSIDPSPDGSDSLSAALRNAYKPVISRIENDRILLDPRTVLHDQDDELLDVIKSVLLRTQS